MTKRVALLCDIPGLWWGATKFSKGKVDYNRLRQLVQGDRSLVISSAFLLERDGLERFEAALRHMGYDTTTIPRDDGTLDDRIHTLAHRMAINGQVDVVAIAASSGKYQRTRDALAQYNVQLEIWAFPVECPLDELNGRCDSWNMLGKEVLQAA